MHEWLPVTYTDSRVDAPVTVVQDLTLAAGACPDRAALRFHIVNETARALPYDRAVLLEFTDRRPRVGAISGQMPVEPAAPRVVAWRKLTAGLSNPGRARPLVADDFSDASGDFTELARQTDGLAVLWLPIKHGDRVVGGLWLERWGTATFTSADADRLTPLAEGYALAWRAVGSDRPWLAALGRRRWLISLVLAATILAALVFIRVPLRIVAPCEVVPDAAALVAAPASGVIEELLVEPGEVVAAGASLARYDDRIVQEELRMAEQQVAMIAADLARARTSALEEPTARAEVALLENRLAQEETRLRMAADRAGRLLVTAPRAGTVILDDPAAWSGRPVQLGERILRVADPQQTKLLVKVPVTDVVALDEHEPVTVILASDPAQPLRAHVNYASNHAEVGANQQTFFRVEAEWITDQAPSLGQRGSAVLNGPEVSLGYWLLRRPLAAVRTTLGV